MLEITLLKFSDIVRAFLEAHALLHSISEVSIRCVFHYDDPIIAQVHHLVEKKATDVPV